MKICDGNMFFGSIFQIKWDGFARSCFQIKDHLNQLYEVAHSKYNIISNKMSFYCKNVYVRAVNKEYDEQKHHLPIIITLEFKVITN